MDRLEAIRQRCAVNPCTGEDADYLLSEVDRLNKVVPGYAESARVIALYLDQFCDRSLPYPDMIADAARKADAVITVLTAETQKLTARAEAAEADLRKCAPCWLCKKKCGIFDALDQRKDGCCHNFEWRGLQEAGTVKGEAE